MLVYGDVERNERFADKRDAVAAAVESASRLSQGLERHGALVSAFIALSELVQGVADAGFEVDGGDTVRPDEEAGLRCLLGLARAVDASWRGEEAALTGLADLRLLTGPDTIRTKEAEGYAFYALYPEFYLEAARASGLPRATRVIGIRSIGTGLAALVAAALDAPPPVTLRPAGHPFRRELRIDAALAARILDGAEAFAVVDEGPGLSGSSFGAVIDWLEGEGVPRERIHAFPSHRGDLGPQASEAHRARWAALSRHVADGDALLARRLPAWIADCLGPLDEPLRDISGGAWRAALVPEEGWPAANLQQERRKFVAVAGGEAWLARFAGIGAAGERKLALARTLAEAGFTPPVAGLRHGFLVERWLEDARPLRAGEAQPDVLIERFAAYLGFRARLPAESCTGASPEELLAMARHNTGLALGEAAAARIRFDAASLAPRLKPCPVDGRMLPHEWLALPDGRFVKADAVDHHAAHDLVGCQDIAWDVAGAAVEFGFTDEETLRLARAVSREAGRSVVPDVLAFHRVAYLAFRLGAATMAAAANGPGEAPRLEADAQRYAGMLARVLEEERLSA